MPQAINLTRQARNKLRRELGLTMKQLRKRRILNNYDDDRDGTFTLKVKSPGGQVDSPRHFFEKQQGEPS